MIFKQHQQVLDGSKTQTRRLVKPGDQRHSGNPWVTQADGRLRWWIGNTYAVQPGRAKKGLGRIRLTDICRQHVQSISRIDAQAEGILCPNCRGYHDRSCNCRWLYAKLWDSIHRKPYRWEDNPEVWVLKFQLIGSDNQATQKQTE